MAQISEVNLEQAGFLRMIEELAQIGLLPEEAGSGRNRYPFSAADREARAFFRREAEASSLTVALDGAANLSARLDCGDPAAKTLLLGSHLDTVPHGGAYDGALGVLAGLEVLRALKENEVQLRYHIEVVDFTDEEGHFGHFFGSGALSGQLTDDQIVAFIQSAVAYPDDLAKMQDEVPGGLTLESVRGAQRDPSTLVGYLELHIEQGPRLEHAGVPIGVVNAIFGRRSWRITFHGRSDHAGTTPLALRSDALVAAAHFIASVPEIIGTVFPDAVVTCGNLIVQPGVYNVVPNVVTVWVEFRAGTQKELDGITQTLTYLAVQATARTGTSHTGELTSQSAPTAMDSSLQSIIHEAALHCGYSTLTLPSGAGHDAMMLASVTPAAMLFVPSYNGRSHCPDEYTKPDDLVAGATVLLQAVLTLAAR